MNINGLKMIPRKTKVFFFSVIFSRFPLLFCVCLCGLSSSLVMFEMFEAAAATMTLGEAIGIVQQHGGPESRSDLAEDGQSDVEKGTYHLSTWVGIIYLIISISMQKGWKMLIFTSRK